MHKDNGQFYVYTFFLMVASVYILIGALLGTGCISRRDIPSDFQGVVPTNGPTINHVVKPGETLWRIARNYGVPMEKIAWVNGIEDPTKIIAGEKLIIPGVVNKTGSPDILIKDFVPFTGKELQWPLKGEISNEFDANPYHRHDGIDIPAPKGTPIRAAAPGKVVYSGDQFSGYGKMIIIEHNDELSTIYAHCDVLLVYEDDIVTAGHIIAKVGDTGRTTGYHLHFEVRKNNQAVDPSDFLAR
jgi:hypothetical protein